MAGRIRKMWEALKRPPVRLSLGAVLIIGAVSAWIAWGSFVFVIEETSTTKFCAGACHEMNISFVEYQQSPHAHNRTGVTASCSQCHIPQASMIAKVLRKTQAGWTDVVGKMSGVIDTPEKFEAHRKEMAEFIKSAKPDGGTAYLDATHKSLVILAKVPTGQDLVMVVRPGLKEWPFQCQAVRARPDGQQSASEPV